MTYGFEEQVDDTVEERHVCGHESEDGLLYGHLEGSDQVYVDDTLHRELFGVCFGMIFCFPSFFAYSSRARL